MFFSLVVVLMIFSKQCRKISAKKSKFLFSKRTFLLTKGLFFSEIRVRTWAQAVSCQKPDLSLADLTVLPIFGRLNSCSDFGSQKKPAFSFITLEKRTANSFISAENGYFCLVLTKQFMFGVTGPGVQVCAKSCLGESLDKYIVST